MNHNSFLDSGYWTTTQQGPDRRSSTTGDVLLIVYENDAEKTNEGNINSFNPS